MIAMQNFLKLFDIIFYGTLRRWIPGLKYKICRSDDERRVLFQDPANYDDRLRCEHHCLKINNLWLDFHRDREILGVERAFIEWSLEKALEYAPCSDNEFLKRAIADKLPKFMIATYLLFDYFNLNSPWKQFSGKIEYFGCTETHYELTRRDLFNDTEIHKIDDVIGIMDSVEKFSASTNEGTRFSFSLMVAANTETADSILWKELVEKQYVKSLAHSAMLFIVNEKGEFIDYKRPVISESRDFFANIFPMPPTVPEDMANVAHIRGECLRHPENNFFMFSAKKNGDIFLYKNVSFNFFQRNGEWHYFNRNTIASILAKTRPFYTERQGDGKGRRIDALDEAIKTIVIILIEQMGCCLGIIPETVWREEFEGKIITGDADKFVVACPSIDNVFWKNDVSIRQKLLGIDGAVLVGQESGKIYGVGTIIPNQGAASQGARTTAAIAIAKMGGLAIKISDDGYCAIYYTAGEDREVSVYCIGA